MKQKTKKATIEINYGMDNFCYLCTLKDKRMMDIVGFMKDFDGKRVIIKVEEISS